jgi:plastocyanin
MLTQATTDSMSSDYIVMTSVRRIRSRRVFLRSLSLLGLAGIAGVLTSCKREKTARGSKPIVLLGGEKGELTFAPDRLHILVGDTVTWVVRSGGHTVTAYHPQNHSSYLSRIPERAKPWDSELLIEQGAHFLWTFETEGVYNYFCRPHESVAMVGAIVVGKALDGPGLLPPQPELPLLARRRLTELINWTKTLR